MYPGGCYVTVSGERKHLSRGPTRQRSSRALPQALSLSAMIGPDGFSPALITTGVPSHHLSLTARWVSHHKADSVVYDPVEVILPKDSLGKIKWEQRLPCLQFHDGRGARHSQKHVMKHSAKKHHYSMTGNNMSDACYFQCFPTGAVITHDKDFCDVFYSHFHCLKWFVIFY